MTREQRKIDIINWITNLQNESYLLRLEELRKEANAELPQEVFEVLEKSSSISLDQYTKHTSVKNFKR